MSRKGKEPFDSPFIEITRPRVFNYSGEGSSRWVIRQNNMTYIAENILQNPYEENIRFSMAFTIAEIVEKGFYEEATNEHDYLTRVSDYIQRIPDTQENLRDALVDLASQIKQLDNSQVEYSQKLHYDDIVDDAEDLAEEHLKEAFNIHLWQLFEVVSRVKAHVRAQLLNSVAIPMIWLLYGDKAINLPQHEPQQQQPPEEPLSDSNTTLPPQHEPQQQQPPAEPLSDSNTTLPPQHEPQQQQPPAGPLSDSNTTLPPQQQLQPQQSGPSGGSD